MERIPSSHQLKVRHATRRLSKQVIGLCGRRSSRQIDSEGFKRCKHRLFLDLDTMQRLARRLTEETAIGGRV